LPETAVRGGEFVVWFSARERGDSFPRRSRPAPIPGCYFRRRSARGMYDGWNFNSGNYLFTTDTK